jgi:beta-aspartyl-peptidase (threonine type)
VITPALVVHGGAGSVDDQRAPGAEAGCAAAVRDGLAVLAEGGTAMDAVVAAVRVLEDDPEFNAGVGACLTRDGTIEVDAALMDGATLRIGALAAMPNLRRPIDLARLILEDGEHVLLCGEGAWLFARERGITPVLADVLITDRARHSLEAERQRRAGSPWAARPVGGGTVGACAIDREGHVAAATSTGGITFKRRGRIGDTPLPGCGTYADDQGGAASATGHGESIIRVTMTRVLVDQLKGGASATAAAWAAVKELERVDGHAGIICVDREGRIGVAHNTPRMSYGYATLSRPEPTTGVQVAGESGLHSS